MLLNRVQLGELADHLRQTPTLSAYIDTSSDDPAARAAWLTEARNAIDGLREKLVSRPHAEQLAFDRAASRLEMRLRGLRNAHRAPSWMLIVADGDVHHFGALPTRLKTELHWQLGPRLGPYAQLLKQERPVIVTLIDAKSVTLYRYSDGTVRTLTTKHALRRGGHADHMGDTPRQHFHGGTRGTTAHDEAERAHRVAAQRLLSRASEAIVAAAIDDAWIVIGGARELPAQLRELLPYAARERSIALPDALRKLPRQAIAQVALRGAELLRAERDRVAVEQLLEQTGAHANGVVGAVATLDALEHGAASELLLTPGFIDAHGMEADRAIDHALDDGTAIEVVTGAAAADLDARGGGVGAVLRFAMHAPATS